MIKVKQHGGDFTTTVNFLKKLQRPISIRTLRRYGEKGVAALAAATPVDTGKTASSWYYKITETDASISLTFLNSNIQNGVPISIILQYGHATRNGGWVEGRDYINPAIRPIFDELAKKGWEEVINHEQRDRE